MSLSNVRSECTQAVPAYAQISAFVSELPHGDNPEPAKMLQLFKTCVLPDPTSSTGIPLVTFDTNKPHKPDDIKKVYKAMQTALTDVKKNLKQFHSDEIAFTVERFQESLAIIQPALEHPPEPSNIALPEINFLTSRCAIHDSMPSTKELLWNSPFFAFGVSATAVTLLLTAIVLGASVVTAVGLAVLVVFPVIIGVGVTIMLLFNRAITNTNQKKAIQNCKEPRNFVALFHDFPERTQAKIFFQLGPEFRQKLLKPRRHSYINTILRRYSALLDTIQDPNIPEEVKKRAIHNPKLLPLEKASDLEAHLLGELIAQLKSAGLWNPEDPDSGMREKISYFTQQGFN